MTEKQIRELLILSRITLAASDLQHEEERPSHDRLVKATLDYGRHLRITADEINVVLKKSVQDVVWPR